MDKQQYVIDMTELQWLKATQDRPQFHAVDDDATDRRVH